MAEAINPTIILFLFSAKSCWYIASSSISVCPSTPKSSKPNESMTFSISSNVTLEESYLIFADCDVRSAFTSKIPSNLIKKFSTFIVHEAQCIPWILKVISSVWSSNPRFFTSLSISS